MAQKTLNAFVVIGGRVDNTFGQIGSELIALGSTVDEISSKLLRLGQESIEVYSDYEYNMKQVEGIWGSNGTFAKGSQELADAMNEAEMAAAEWAANSIFHTNDISNAMVEAAHAGWNLEEMLGGIPYAMKLAQAGDMDLSTSLNYVLKSMEALGMEYDELPRWVDEWVYAANRSAGTAQEFGDTMLKMGSTMRFAEDPEELLALTKIMHDMGATGSEAGTLVRNSMLKILAPSGVASKILAQLGATQDEIDSVMQDAGKLKALNELESVGFSAFDDKGQAKSILEIYASLGASLAEMAGGWDNISKNQKTLGILSNVFGVRAQTGALNLIAGLKEANELYGELKEGAAEGAAQYMSDTMMDSLYGKTELLKSKWEEMERVIGQQVAPQVESIEGNLGKIIDKFISAGQKDNGVSSGLDFLERISGWAADLTESFDDIDPATFDGITAGLGTIATLGPGMIAVGSGIRLASWALGTPAGRIMLAAAAITTLVEATNAMKEADFKGAFGNLSLNEQELKPITDAIHADFMNAYSGINQYRQAITEAGNAYTEASQKLSSTMLTDMLTGKELTDDDLKAYYGYGNQMFEAVLKGLKESNDLSTEYWKMLASDNGEIDMSEFADPQYQSLIATLDAAYESSVGEVIEIGKKLRGAITQAFSDGKLSQEEYENILSYFNDLNEKMVEAQAQAKNREAAIQREKMLHKAQTLSYDSMNDYIENVIVAQRQAELDQAREEYEYQRAKAVVAWDERIASAHGHKAKEALTAQKNENEKYIDAQFAEEEAKINAWYDEPILTLQETALHQSEYGEADAYWESLIKRIGAGEITGAEALNEARNTPYWQNDFLEKFAGFFSGNINMGSDLDKTANYYNEMITHLGGEEEVERRIAMYRETGQTAMADRLQILIDKSKTLDRLIYYNDFPMPGQTLGTYVGGETPERVIFTEAEKETEETGEAQEARQQLYGQAGRRQEEERNVTPLEDAKGLIEAESAEEWSAKSYLMQFGEVLAGNISQRSAVNAPLSSAGQEQIDTIYAYLNSAYDLDAVAASMGSVVEQSAYRDYFALYDLLYGEAGKQAEAYRRGAAAQTAEEAEATERSVTFPDAEENAAAAHEAMEAQFTPIEQTVYVNTYDGAGETETITEEDPLSTLRTMRTGPAKGYFDALENGDLTAAWGSYIRMTGAQREQLTQALGRLSDTYQVDALLANDQTPAAADSRYRTAYAAARLLDAEQLFPSYPASPLLDMEERRDNSPAVQLLELSTEQESAVQQSEYAAELARLENQRGQLQDRLAQLQAEIDRNVAIGKDVNASAAEKNAASMALMDNYYTGPGLFSQKKEVQAQIETTEAAILTLKEQEAATIPANVEIDMEQVDAQLSEGEHVLPVDAAVAFPDAQSNAATAHSLVAAQFTPIYQTVYIRTIGTGGGGGGMTYTTLGADGKPEMLKPRAEGGRGTEPSIFAEAGVPEWFIPERHDDNTLRLILGAAEMSGFSLIDLAAYAGADMYAEGGSTEDRRIPFARGSGGRGEKPSIFAEAGVPEWFIPERHDDNTLRLILGAAEMSGFSMIDLAAYAGADMYAEGGTTSGAVNWGSLSDSSGSSGGSAGGDTIKVQYSPVIHADNADGVNQVLRDDKKRMKKMLRELLEEKELYESVVAYR